MANAIMHQFVSGLKSRSEEVRLKAARDLHHYVRNLKYSILIPNDYLSFKIYR